MFNEEQQSILIPFFFSQLPFALLLFAIGCFKVQADTEPPIATVEIVEEEIEIVFIRPPTQEEIDRARAYNLANPL